MRAGISSENSSIRRSGIAVSNRRPRGSKRTADCHARLSAPSASSATSELSSSAIVLDVDVNRLAGAAKLAGVLDRGLVGRALGRKRVGMSGRDDDRPAVMIRKNVVTQCHDAPQSNKTVAGGTPMAVPWLHAAFPCGERGVNTEQGVNTGRTLGRSHGT